VSARVALVFGGSGGIGSACALELARAGMDVAVAARGSAGLDRVADGVRSAGRRAAVARADLADDAAVRAAVAACARELGGLDVLVSAGGGGPRGRALDLDDAAWREALEVKVLGPIRAVRAAVDLLARSGHGAVVLVSGTGGREPKAEAAAVSLANAATANLVKALADDLAPRGIRVNAVAPGQVRTGRYAVRVEATASQRGIDSAAAERLIAEQIPLGRPADPAEIARAVRFLASDDASYLTGTTLIADGGWTRAGI
jgi:3-oxoacyl-[acyl-carrier protein] reductase